MLRLYVEKFIFHKQVHKHNEVTHEYQTKYDIFE